MGALKIARATYRDKVVGAWQGKSAGVTLGAALRGRMTPGLFNYYSPVPGQPIASVAMDFPLVWMYTLETTGPEVTPEDLALAWLEHLDYSQEEFGYAALNLRRGLPPPASGAYSNWFKHAAGGVMRADFWAQVAPGSPQVAAAYAYHDAKLDHSEEGLWAAMFLAALGSAAFFLTDPLLLLTIGLAMMPRTCRTARAVKTAIAAGQRAASWLEARECVLNDVGDKNYTDTPQNMGFFTIGLLYGRGDFGASLCAGVNCGYDAEAVGAALGAVLGTMRGGSGMPENWTSPLGDLVIPGVGVRDFDAPTTISELAERIVSIGEKVVRDRCSHLEIVETMEPVETPFETPLAPPTLPAPVSSASFLELPDPALTMPEQGPTASDIPPDPTSPQFEPIISPSAGALSAPIASQDMALGADDAPGASIGGDTVNSMAANAATDGEPVSATAGSDSDTTMPGVFRPQPISQSPPPNTGALADLVSDANVPVSAVVPVAPDPVDAIAWADSTLVKPLLVTPSNAMTGQIGPFEVVMDTHDSPTIAYNQAKTLSFSIYNRGDQPFTGRLTLLAPSGWHINAPAGIGQRQYIAAQTGVLRADFTVRALPGQARIDIANAITLRFAPEGPGAPHEAEFMLLGASCWWTVGAFANFDGEGFDRMYGPEERPGLRESYMGRSSQSVSWERQAYHESVLDLEPIFKGGSGVCYGQTILRSPTARNARLVANTNSGVKLWLNGDLVLRRFNRQPFRPLLGEGPWAVDVRLNAGDNPVMLKWVRGSEPFAFSLTVSDRYGRGLPEVGNTEW